MDLHLRGKTAVVTGASKGIGLAITRALISEGARVAAGAQHGSAELDQLAEHGQVLPIHVDLTTPDGPTALISAAIDEFGELDVLVNNVGAVRPRVGGFLTVTDDDWTWALTINFMAAVRTMRAALPHLLRSPRSTIVTVASVNAFLPDPAVIDYSAAKGALTNVCKSLSKEYAARGLRINTVSPGPVQTDLWLGDNGMAATITQNHRGSPRRGRRGRRRSEPHRPNPYPQEVADLVVLLAGDRAGNTTGADFVIDGGLTPTL